MRFEATQRTDGGVPSGGSAAPDTRLRALTERALQRACTAAELQDVQHDGGRELIRQACDVAHERCLRAEQLLVLVKETWRSLPEALRLPRHEACDVLARVITVCIEEYYVGKPGGDDSRATSATSCGP